MFEIMRRNSEVIRAVLFEDSLCLQSILRRDSKVIRAVCVGGQSMLRGIHVAR